MKSFVKINKITFQRKLEYFKNYLKYAQKIKKKAQELLGKDTKVLVFGSIVKGNWGTNSDIDVLVISKRLSSNWIENREIRTEIRKVAGTFNPFQIHLATPEEYENWYKRFIKEDYIEVK